MRAVGAGLLLACCLAFGCAEKRSARCEQVCQREADCGEKLDDDTVNKGECVKECNELERHEKGAELIAHHIECVSAAADCRAVLACP